MLLKRLTPFHGHKTKLLPEATLQGLFLATGSLQPRFSPAVLAFR